MGFWSRAFGIPDETEERSLISIGDETALQLFGFTESHGVAGESAAMTLSAVYRGVSLISGSIASLPLRTMIDTPTGRERSSSVLDNPGGDVMTPFEWKQLVMVNLILHGNAFLQHQYNAAGALTALIPVHPACVSVEWDESRPGGKLFTVNIDGKRFELDATSMTQIMGVSFDGLHGLSVISQARLSFSTSKAGDRAANRTFTNGALISGLVTPVVDGDLTADEAKELKVNFENSILGVDNAGGISVINKDLKFTPWQLSAADAQFLESRTFQIDEIGRWLGTPPHLLGLTEKSTSWGQGIAEQNRGLARYTLTPWTTPIEEKLSRLIPGKFAEFDYKQFVKPSPEDEIALLIQEMNSGLLTPNEARKIMNLPPVDGGDVPRIPAGSMPPDMFDDGGTNGR